ncbi:MAG: hypothetical protein IKD62_02255, partial [Oscillospiraceae bacterium]|nr:hypothetical protein [Oscillospiraceae bacterium]
HSEPFPGSESSMQGLLPLIIKEGVQMNQEDVATIMNLINDALEETEYEAVGYDNTGIWLSVIIDKK